MKAKGWFGLVLFAACAPSGDAIAPPAESKNEACVPGEQSACACPNGDEGVQLCNDDGSAFGACSCEGSSGTFPFLSDSPLKAPRLHPGNAHATRA